MNNKRKEELYEEVRELYYNNVLSIKDLALRYGKSERTIYRWLNHPSKDGRIDNSKINLKNSRKKRYPT
ncbi:MAG: helix-turn-helix domain-containing protein [Promethearchaeota archaeon]